MNMNVDKNIIKKLRLEKSWSQEKLAEASGMNLRTIQRIEKDGAASLQSCASIASAFGVEPKDLAFNTETAIIPSQFHNPHIAPALIINSIVFILWGLSQVVTSVFTLTVYQDSVVSFLFLFFAGVVLLAFLTPIANWRLFAIFAFLLIAMLVAPASISSLLFLALPMWALFELSLLLARRYKAKEYSYIKAS